MAAAAVVVAAVGAAVGVMGALEQGKAESQAADYNADIAEKNANAAHAQAVEDERRQRILGRRELGSLRANYGASGVTLEGSPMEILEQSAANAELDALTIRHQGEMKATAYRQEAQLYKMKSANAKTASYYRAAGSLLGSGSSALGAMS